MSVTAVPIRPLARGSVLRLWAGLALLALAAAALAWWSTAPLQRQTTESGLQYQVLEEGEGAQISSADALRIHFIGRRESGEVFANTLGGQPLETTPDSFIPGFGEGLKLMRRGARYRLWIPPALGYRGEVPPTAPFGPDETLVFDIQVVDVAPGMAALLQMQQMQQMMREGGPPRPPGGDGGDGGEGGAGGDRAPEGGR